jgi:hypothetical protein
MAIKSQLFTTEKTIYPDQSLMSDGRCVLGFITTCTQSSRFEIAVQWHHLLGMK